MLISFEVENFLSIYERQEISFVASNLKGANDGLIETEALSGEKLLPALLIYGANASGKTNLIKAFSAMVSTIVHSHARGKPGRGIPTYSPYLLDDDAAEKPASFECNFIVAGVRYNYGFEFSDKIIIREWLYSYPKKAPRKLFDREGEKFSFGRFLKGKNSSIASLTRDNSLFLSASAQNKHEQLTDIFEFFDGINIEMSLSMSSFDAEERLRNDHKWNIDSEVIKFLEEINTGIVGYRVKEKEIPDETRDIQSRIDAAMETALKGLEGQFKVDHGGDKEIELEHRGNDGKTVHFPIQLESAGTRRLLSSLPKIFEVLKSGGIIIIDELDLSIHTQAAEALIQFFSCGATNPNSAQILATTHDTNLLQCECLRRDQVWFAEKSDTGETQIFPLTDIHTRATDNIEKGYLQGRFGAVPM